MGKIVLLHDSKECDPFRDPAERVAERLVKVFGYKHGVGLFLAEHIRELYAGLHEPFLRYWNAQQLDESLTVSGINLGEAARLCGDVFQAFFWLDSMHKNPRETTARWKRALAGVGRPKSPGIERWSTYSDSPPSKIAKW